jgi:hypothetical protein
LVRGQQFSHPGRRFGLVHSGLIRFRLRPARSLEQLRVDCESHLHGTGQHLAGRRTDVVGKSVLQPLLEEVVGNADHEQAFFPGKSCIGVKPEIVTWLPDALGDGLAQRCHDFLFVGRQGTPRRAVTVLFFVRLDRKRGIARGQEGKAWPGLSTRRTDIVGWSWAACQRDLTHFLHFLEKPDKFLSQPLVFQVFTMPSD